MSRNILRIRPNQPVKQLTLDRCDAKAIKHDNPAESEADLMQYVETYFQGGVQDPSQRIRRTQLGPIYFQHAGHSLTIIGFEKLKNGDRNLLVFDPSFRDSSDILSLSTWPDFVHPKPDLALKPYRRGSRYLRMYHQFELLTLVAMDSPRGDLSLPESENG
jgi:hypothetical protein